ncbi:Protein translocase subunit secD [Granulibacter bethesdensis]|uniref:Protein translocase subunit SecD n=2 Tax=Granulibacter bethesdensis TaxID=364410 RepID=A0AAC9KAG2_9PROT|nr:Protein translocase subunit secD [Granulibacter bethesdensis]APH62334.1 Protein translocase subunit secD [Granulibacter bethesdensis]
MLYFSRLKTTTIYIVCLLGMLLCLPNLMARPAAWLPWRTVHLGLDLRGGSYLLMQIDMKAVVRERLESLSDTARQAMRNAHIFYTGLKAEPDANRIVLSPRDPAQLNAAVAALAKAVENEVSASGVREVEVKALEGAQAGQIALILPEAALHDRATAAVQQSIEIVRRRIDQTGVVDPNIARQGEDRIVVQLPGVDDPQRIKDLLGTTAKMTFHMVDASATPAAVPPDDIALPEEGTAQKLVVKRRADVDGADLTDARPVPNQQRAGAWSVSFTFNGVGARKVADITAAHQGERFAIVLDNRIISAPVIQSVIPDGRGEITGNFTAKTAQDLAVLLRAGALPAPLSVVEERSVGPELGADSIRAGAYSLAAGFVLVILFMGMFYGLFGWMANLALLMNLIMLLGALSLLEATLTLPGMAGILLTLGMAVDANILINERIREETKAGRPPVAAMEAGFKRAWATVLDSNMTALLAHVMLFVFGTGPVRGFAVTITVGIATTLFTNFMLARLLMVKWFARNRPAELPV